MNSTQYKSKLEVGLTKYLDQQISKSPSPESKVLLKRLKKVISLGGKRTRPKLFYLTYKAYGGKDKPLSVGMSIELLHQALLIHDDLIDEDNTRHGKPNMVGLYQTDPQYGSTNIPYAMALLTGDLVFSLVNQIIINDAKLTNKNKLDILSLFNQTIMSTIYGQQLDSYNIDGSLVPFDDSRLIKIHSLKTAGYSSLLPISLSIILANVPKKDIARLTNFAKTLGIYIQLVNDYEDYFKKQQGDYLLGDFSSGKLTYPLIAAQNITTATQLKKLNKHFSKQKLSPSQKDKVVDILISSGAQQASKDYINSYLKKSKDLLNDLNIKEQNKNEILALIDSLKV